MEATELTYRIGPFSSMEGMATIFCYPDLDYGERVEKVYQQLLEEEPEAAEEMRPFRDKVREEEWGTLERLYQGTFDIQAITTLDISYVLFGDDYKRGQMLSYLQRDQRSLGIDPGTELPDHLSNFLITLARLRDDVLRDDLVKKALLPALEQILEDFGEERMAQKKKLYRKYHKGILETPEATPYLYLHPLRALKMILEGSFGQKVEEMPASDAQGFLGNLDREIAVEHTRSSSF